MTSPISANTFSRALSSPDHMIGRAKNYTDTAWKDFVRCIAAMLSFGLTEYWHANHVEEVEEAFVIALKGTLNAELVEEDHEKRIEVTTPFGILKIVQKNAGDGLEATFDEKPINIQSFTTIEALRDTIKTHLENNSAIAERYLSSKESQERVESIIKIQANFRRYNATQVKEPRADAPALRDSKGKPIAFATLGLLQPRKHFPYVAYPKKEAPNKPEGGYKTLTHLTPGPYNVQPGDTLSTIAVKIGQSCHNLKAWNNLANDAVQDGQVLNIVPNGSTANQYGVAGLTLRNPDAQTLASNLLVEIGDLKLDKIKLQVRIDEYHVMSDYLGSADLYNHIFRTKNPYQFDPSHFAELAQNIDTLHSKGIVHRDIKLDNMFFIDGHVYLTDFDFAGRVGTFQAHSGTPLFITRGFVENGNDNAGKRNPFSAYARDRYSFLLSMMVAYYKDEPTYKWGRFAFIRFTTEQISQFTKQMPCDDTMQQQLENFLCEPTNNPLPLPLADYFKGHTIQVTTTV